MRANLTTYLRDRGYDTAEAPSYDDGMTALPSLNPTALVIDIQGLKPGEDGTTFGYFSQWLVSLYQGEPPAIIYLLQKGSRKPPIKIEGPILKKPFPIEAIGEALRERIGRPLGDGYGSKVELDLGTNTLTSVNGTTHLTNIEATLLAYLMQHEGETLNPQALLVDVWQYHHAAGASTLVRAHVSNLRRKLREVHGESQLIHTVRGKGYRYIA